MSALNIVLGQMIECLEDDYMNYKKKFLGQYTSLRKTLARQKMTSDGATQRGDLSSAEEEMSTSLSMSRWENVACRITCGRE